MKKHETMAEKWTNTGFQHMGEISSVDRYCVLETGKRHSVAVSMYVEPLSYVETTIALRTCQKIY